MRRGSRRAVWRSARGCAWRAGGRQLAACAEGRSDIATAAATTAAPEPAAAAAQPAPTPCTAAAAVAVAAVASAAS